MSEQAWLEDLTDAALAACELADPDDGRIETRTTEENGRAIVRIAPKREKGGDYPILEVDLKAILDYLRASERDVLAIRFGTGHLSAAVHVAIDAEGVTLEFYVAPEPDEEEERDLFGLDVDEEEEDDP